MSILIAGFGDLGRHIASELRRNPSLMPGNIYALSRHVDQSALPEGVQAFAADLTVPETLTSLPADITYVVYCVSADASNEQAYQSAYVQGLHNLLDCLTKRPHMPRVLFVSSTAVYGKNAPLIVDESSETCPTRFNGKIMLSAERLLLNKAPSSVVLRLSGIYGPGRHQLLKRLQSGLANIPNTPGYWSNRIHIEDAARAVIHLLINPSFDGVFIGSDSTPLPLETTYTDLAARIGALPPNRAQPSPMMGKKQLSNQKLLSTGFEFKWPDSRIGYQGVIDSYKTSEL